jgi:peptide/nickel transport system permease protein
MREIESKDFVRAARAKGLRERTVVRRHILRPALPPLLAVLGLDLGGLITGAIVTEVLFDLPGLAQLTIQALVDLDLPLIVGVVLTSAFFVIVCNLAVDVLHAALDPRILS